MEDVRHEAKDERSRASPGYSSFGALVFQGEDWHLCSGDRLSRIKQDQLTDGFWNF